MICGFKDLSLIDYPGHMASVVFVGGCNFRCPFCHNRTLVLSPDEIKHLDIDEITGRMKDAKTFIDAVVITGGEPTIWKDLESFIEKVKALGLKVKLDTNGSRPDVIKNLLAKGLLDYIAMDIKTSFERYHKASGVNINPKLIKESITLIKESGIEHEFRTTCVPGLIDETDIRQISNYLGKNEHYTLQQFRPETTIDPWYEEVKAFSAGDMLQFQDAAAEAGLKVKVI